MTSVKPPSPSTLPCGIANPMPSPVESIFSLSRTASRNFLYRAESGEFDIQDFKLTAISILTIFKGLEIPIFIKIDESHFEERVDNLIHLILNGLAKR